MTHAYIYDAIRTPRGRAKETGSLHALSPLALLKTLYDALAERNPLDKSQVDDVNGLIENLIRVFLPILEQPGRGLPQGHNRPLDK